MTTLITGAGLIGRLTAEMLAARGDRVVLADIRDPGLRGLPFVHCDVTDVDALDDIVRTHTVRRIVHTAAMLSTGIRANPARGVAVNVLGTTNVLDCARRLGLGRVVCASSTTVGYTMFASHGPTPIEEDLSLRMLAQRPASLYAASKIASEQLGLLYHDLYGLDVVLLRYAAVLGGGGPASSVPGRLLEQLAAGGRSGETVVLDDPFLLWAGREEFVDARDCARANLAALDAKAPVQRVYNVATGDWCSLDEFVAIMRGVFPRLRVSVPTPSSTGFAGFPHLRPAPSETANAARELGFSAKYRLTDIIAHWCAAHSG